jgi:hypothetical protein
MTHPSGPRKTANLSNSVHRQLNLYAIGATAAGVGILALAQTVEGKIVYTPAHMGILYGEQAPFDIDNSGGPDFYFSDYGSFSRNHSLYLKIRGLVPGNSVVAAYGAAKHAGAAALEAGVRVGPKRHFVNRTYMARVTFQGSNGTNPMFFYPWANGGKGVKKRYLGIKFVVEGKVHYGWARLNVFFGSDGSVVGRLTGYAYETIPNKPITTGQTNGSNDTSINAPIASLAAPATQRGSLGMLAQGASTLSIWRREESAGETQ